LKKRYSFSEYTFFLENDCGVFFVYAILYFHAFCNRIDNSFILRRAICQERA
jgi:hypothetical protein